MIDRQNDLRALFLGEAFVKLHRQRILVRCGGPQPEGQRRQCSGGTEGADDITTADEFGIEGVEEGVHEVTFSRIGGKTSPIFSGNRAVHPGTQGVLACEFGRRFAARTACRGEDAPQIAAEDGCGPQKRPRLPRRPRKIEMAPLAP
ncbi:hypothetical protein LBMAG56_19060 [Verrucomicrobiota bacterium]|nr:hypothetical protein LBMAG56_19060 [Verrucomicrobiota bacterium]